MDEIKIGMRNNEGDRARIASIRDMATAIVNTTNEMEPQAQEDAPEVGSDGMQTLVMGGSAVKALGDGKVGGYLMVWGSPDQTDMERDYFDATTNIGDANKSAVFYHHGLDKTIGKKSIGGADIGRDDVGVWVKAQLDLSDRYTRAIYAMAEKGKLGWSSGTASHLVEREQVGKAWHIKTWLLGLDASLTPTPAEPRARAMALKSLDVPELEALIQADGESANQGDATAYKSISDSEVIAMDENVISTKLDSVLAGVDKLSDRVVALETKSDLGFKSLKVEDVLTTPYKPFKAGGFGDFLMDVKAAADSNGRVSDRLKSAHELAIKATGMNEGVGSDGGFLVQTDFVTSIMERAYTTGQLSSRVQRYGVSANSNGMSFLGDSETSRADGSRWGGVRGYRLAEAAQKTSSYATFRKMELKLKKYAVLAYATDELLADAQVLGQYISRKASQELDFMLNDDLLNGLGVAGPLGILAAPALVTVAKEAGQAAATLVFQNVVKMWSRLYSGSRATAAWYINQDIEPQLFTMNMAVGTGGVPVYMPAGGISGAPFATLFGRPVIPTEWNATLGTIGDIVLADMQSYLFIDKGAPEAATSIHIKFDYDETAFRFVYRCDGQPEWGAALTPYKGSNTQSPFVALATRS